MPRARYKVMQYSVMQMWQTYTVPHTPLAAMRLTSTLLLRTRKKILMEESAPGTHCLRKQKTRQRLPCAAWCLIFSYCRLSKVLIMVSVRAVLVVAAFAIVGVVAAGYQEDDSAMPWVKDPAFAADDGYTTTSSGLRYQLLGEGSGKPVKKGDKIKVTTAAAARASLNFHHT